MRRLANFLIRLYPAAWRARYGEEFQALLEDAPPDGRALFDLFTGALQMQSSIVNFPRLALILSGAGLLAGFGLSYLVAPRFISSAELSLSSPVTGDSQHRNVAEIFMQLVSGATSRTSLSAVIQDPRLDLYPRERLTTPLEDVIETMRTRDIKIEPVQHEGVSGKDWMAFRVRFACTNAHKAQEVIQTLLVKFQEENLTVQRDRSRAAQNVPLSELNRLEDRVDVLEKKLGITPEPPFPYAGSGPVMPGINLEVIDPPSYPENPASPNRAIFSALGFGAGFAIAALLAAFRRRMPPALPSMPEPAS